MKRWVHGVLLSGLLAGVAGILIHPGSTRDKSIRHQATESTRATSRDVTIAINGLDLSRAERLLSGLSAPPHQLALMRARLALYRGDCDQARALTASIGEKEGSTLNEVSELAEGCARVVAGSKVITDEARGVWVRIQDDADESWVKWVIDVAARARDETATKLGKALPRPLRIELVLDHASLSALTGLPLDAAETTGTVAIARWGRVSMLSPRSFAHGYPWQDTLAHEITHLLVTAATNDNAPLWLQEALAKRFENSWRPPRPLDGEPSPHETTLNAWRQGRAVGVENLGASIALLPSPESARIAYAEVYDYLEFILKNSGLQTLRLLLHDLRELGPERVDDALVSTTGYTQKAWNLRWRVALSNEKSSTVPRVHPSLEVLSDSEIEVAREVRVAELLASRLAWNAVDIAVTSIGGSDSERPEVRSLAGLAKLQLRDPEAALAALGTLKGFVGLHSDWLALKGRALEETGNTALANKHFEWALAYAPTRERVSCRGRTQFENPDADPGAGILDVRQRSLCLAARRSASSAAHPPVD
jgi:hypothetical protein